MKKILSTISIVAGAALCLLGGGCSTSTMKGTPFYTGEYGKRRGPAEQRVNGWPVVYYRDPALSVLWPIFELTDDHTAVRPLFSVYGLDRSNREYNVLWPLAQFDRQSGDSRIFPLFWGSNHFVGFPLYWHFDEPWGAKGGTDALLPFWTVNRKGTNELSAWALWPLVHYGYNTKAGQEDSMVFPFYWHERDQNGSLFVSLPWISGHDAKGSWRALTPLFYQASNDIRSILVTPFWAAGKSADDEWQAIIPFAYWDHESLLSPLWAHWEKGDRDTYLAPWSLSWVTHRPERTDLWLAGALAHASWGEEAGSHYILPLYYRDAAHETLLTPLCGWSDSGDYYYPLTPLAGVRNDGHSGSWLFPIYSHARDKKSGDLNDHFLLLGGHSKTKQQSHTYFYPAFSSHDYGPLESTPEPGQSYGHYGSDFWCLPFCWSKNECSARPPNRLPAKRGEAPPPVNTNALIRTYTRKHGVLPLWTYATQSTPAEGKKSVKGSALAWLYDYKHELDLAPQSVHGPTNDYTRARICWRLWHYERQNGDVSVDVFPGFTHDRKTYGFSKTSLLWRFFRYERAPDGAKKLDLLFIPVQR